MAANEQLELARWACAQAKKHGAQEARGSVSRTRNTSLEYRERKVETLEESTVMGLSLSLYIDGKYSAHRTSDLRREAIEAFVKEAVDMTRYLTADEHRRLPEPDYYQGRSNVDLQMIDPGQSKVQPEDRHELTRNIEDAALRKGGN